MIAAIAALATPKPSVPAIGPPSLSDADIAAIVAAIGAVGTPQPTPPSAFAPFGKPPEPTPYFDGWLKLTSPPSPPSYLDSFNILFGTKRAKP